MKKTFLAFGIMAFLGATSAMAADLVAPASYDWNGFSAGFEGGYGFGNTHHYNPPGDTGPLSISGALGGIDVEYNKQLNNVVIGLASDFLISGVSGSHGPALFNPGPNSFRCGSGPCNTNVNWLSTNDLRLGFAANRFLPFVDGGVAIGGVNATIPNAATLAGGNTVRLGWTVGAGVEMAINQKWTGKLEYKYVDLGQWRYDTNNSNFSADAKFSIISASLNYRF